MGAREDSQCIEFLASSDEGWTREAGTEQECTKHDQEDNSQMAANVKRRCHQQLEKGNENGAFNGAEGDFEPMVTTQLCEWSANELSAFS